MTNFIAEARKALMAGVAALVTVLTVAFQSGNTINWNELILSLIAAFVTGALTYWVKNQ